MNVSSNATGLSQSVDFRKMNQFRNVSRVLNKSASASCDNGAPCGDAAIPFRQYSRTLSGVHPPGGKGGMGGDRPSKIAHELGFFSTGIIVPPCLHYGPPLRNRLLRVNYFPGYEACQAF
jgi:hypothetical protein